MALLGQRVEVGVGGGVVALAGGAEGGGDRGEHDEGRELCLRGQLVQVPGGVCLGGKDALEALWVDRLDTSVVEHPGGVDHRAQWVLGGSTVEQLLQLLALGDIAGGDPDLGAQLLELRPQLLGALCLFAGATDQEQVAGAVGLDQVTGHQGPQATGGAGDQDRPVGIEEQGLALLAHQARCPRRQDHSLAKGQLGLLVLSQQGLDRLIGGIGPIAVDQREAAGVLGLGGADQAPSGGESGLG